jgi:hypothetical protein
VSRRTDYKWLARYRAFGAVGHEALGQRPRIRRYHRSPRRWDGRLREPEYAGDAQVRRVRANGEIKVERQTRLPQRPRTGIRGLSGEPVGLWPAEEAATTSGTARSALPASITAAASPATTGRRHSLWI